MTATATQHESLSPANGAHARAINWFEIPCTSLDRAQAFYERVLGRPMLRRNDLGGGPMALFARDLPATGGCLLVRPDRAPVGDAGVRIYLDAAPAVQAALDRVIAAGGVVLDACMELPEGIGFIAHIRDTEGNTIGLHAMAR